ELVISGGARDLVLPRNGVTPPITDRHGNLRMDTENARTPDDAILWRKDDGRNNSGVLPHAQSPRIWFSRVGLCECASARTERRRHSIRARGSGGSLVQGRSDRPLPHRFARRFASRCRGQGNTGAWRCGSPKAAQLLEALASRDRLICCILALKLPS